ncbi:hypothetical protein Hypma_002634 [Hypsizygus marmoreus]|uniref:Uncharacterized protein n=1 Tax=Hypsizygus marmoreus TaxID=39966 RepID=A0A369J4L9_HYPMA|nr:hypothetical protein Hypma_002634 [Hypsizygus marmoreus]
MTGKIPWLTRTSRRPFPILLSCTIFSKLSLASGSPLRVDFPKLRTGSPDASGSSSSRAIGPSQPNTNAQDMHDPSGASRKPPVGIIVDRVLGGLALVALILGILLCRHRHWRNDAEGVPITGAFWSNVRRNLVSPFTAMTPHILVAKLLPPYPLVT